MAEDPLTLYKAFIDGLLTWPRNSVQARRIEEWGTPGPNSYQTSDEFNAQMEQFTPEQRQIVAQLVRVERDSAIHDFLAYLTDHEYHLRKDGVELEWEPFDSMFYDWTCRAAGDAWPDERDGHANRDGLTTPTE